MTASVREKPQPLYVQLASDVNRQVESGALKPGDRLPSVRVTSQQKKLSVTTVLQAYQMLEDQGTIESRPQSGYYVRLQAFPNELKPQPEISSPPLDPSQVDISELTLHIERDARKNELVQLGAAVPDADLLPTSQINRILARIARKELSPLSVCGAPEGCPELRTQIARRLIYSGCSLAPDDILITSGCTEAMNLALKVACRPGDLVAVESPTYFGILQIIELLGLQVLEIPTHYQKGISLEALSFAIEHNPVRAVLVMTNFSNPTGSRMPDENKHQLVNLLEEHGIPLIENDIYGDLSFSTQRPIAAKSFDQNGSVMLCSSFSKDISPGYRVGWISPGKYKAQIERHKISMNLGSPILPQLAIAEFLESGGYERLLQKIRRAYAQKMSYMANSICRYFPQGTRITSPEGGFILWVQMPKNIDSLVLYQKALESGITFAPGYIFSTTSRYRNFIRLNAAYMTFKTESAIKRLGELAASMV